MCGSEEGSRLARRYRGAGVRGRYSEIWRRRPESNWGWRFCRPLPCHLATSPCLEGNFTFAGAVPSLIVTTRSAVRLRNHLPSHDFRDVMARLPAGVVVISARFAGGYRGLTASSLVSVSVDPPMVMVGLEREATTRTAVVEGRAFNLSVLTRSQEFIADRFASRARVRRPAGRRSGSGAPAGNARRC